MSSLPTYTGATRPSSPSAGDAIYLSDVNQLAVYDGDISEWRTFKSDGVVYNAAAPSELHYANGLYDSTSAPYYLDASPVMHFDANFINGVDTSGNPAIGGAVSTWSDRSGNVINYNLTQISADSQATFALTEGQNSLAFSGGDFYSSGTTYTGAAGEDYTAVYVAKIPGATNGSIQYAPLTNGNNPSSMWFNASAYGDLVHGSTARGFTVNNQSAGTAMPTVFNPLHLFIVQRSSSTVTGYTGGNTQQFSHGSITNGTSISEFGRASASYTTSGSIFEVMFFDSALSTANMNAITNYAANKYGISTTSF